MIRGGKGERKGREGAVDRRESEGPQVTVEPGPLRALLRQWWQVMYGRCCEPKLDLV